MSHPGNEALNDYIIDLAVRDAQERGLRGQAFKDHMDQKIDELLGELAAHERFYEDDVCSCGKLIEKCEDAYEHITQGV